MRFLTTRIVVSACLVAATGVGLSFWCDAMNGPTEEFVIAVFGMIGIVALVGNVLYVIWSVK